MRCLPDQACPGRPAYGGAKTANRIPRVVIGGFEGGESGSAIGSPWRLLRAALARRSPLPRAASSTECRIGYMESRFRKRPASRQDCGQYGAPRG